MKAGALLDFVKIEHSLFSLPFVFAGMAFAYEPSGTLARPVEVVFLLAVVAAISARTLAMTLNRLIDKEIDLRNPRTADRALPAGELSQRTAWAIAAASALGLVAAAGLLNRLCLLLSPLLVAAFVVYPFLKRWTAACHFGLGAAWAPAPMGGYLAMTGSFDGSLPVLLLSAAALFWLAGFDILYALLDVDVDRAQGIHSIPADDGVPAALRVARLCHALFVVLLVDAGIAGSVAAGFWVGLVLVVAMLAYEHAIVRPDDPEAINKAFFKANAVVGWVVLLGVLSGLFISLP